MRYCSNSLSVLLYTKAQDVSRHVYLLCVYARVCVSSHLLFCFSEKKKEKEREELWKKLEDLELKRGLRSDGIIPT